MTSTVKTVKRSIVSLDLPRRVPALITMTRGLVTALTNNATTFPAPDPRAGRPQARSPAEADLHRQAGRRFGHRHVDDGRRGPASLVRVAVQP